MFEQPAKSATNWLNNKAVANGEMKIIGKTAFNA